MVSETILLLLAIAGVALVCVLVILAWIMVFWVFDQGILDGLLSHYIQEFIRDKLEKQNSK